ncbi:MAG: flagellar hook-length control protein FliK [Alphaproteobacteria bacterium]|nr:flagellar hook-length control protein FliK [Alphaproteobacteria bacterium]
MLPIAPPAPAPAAGAAAPAGSGAAGFDDLMAALFGGPAETQAQPLAATPTPAGGKLVVSEEGEEIDPEAQGEDALSPDAQAALLGVAQPTPAPASAELTTSTAPAPEAQPVGPGPLAATELAQQPIPTDLPADAAVPDGEATPEAAQVQTAAAPVEDAEAAPTEPAASRPAPNRAAEGIRAETGPQVLADVAGRLTLAASAAGPTALATADPVAQPTAAQPTAAPTAPATAAQASAQPLMTAAAAAGVVTLKASQSGASTTATPDVDSAETQEVTPFKAALTEAKSAFAAQPASPFALTTGATALAAKAEPAVAPRLEPALADATAAAPESVEAGGLDDPDSVGTLAANSTAAPLSEGRDAARPAATSATVADLAAQVSRRLEGRSTHFDIQLTPEGLGRVDVRVDIDAQGKLTAAMAFDSPHAANEMRGRSGELLRALEQAGFDLSGGLSFNSPQDQRGGGQFADQAPERDAWQGRAFQNALGMADEADTAAVATRLYQQRQSPTGVDLRI